jgi:predicted amidohydrolase
MVTRIVKLGLVQMSMTSRRGENLDKAVELVADAAKKGAQVVCLPELFSMRYFPAARESRQSPEGIPGPTSRALSRIAKKFGIILIGGTIFERSGRSRYNTCLVFDEKGRAISKYRKVHVPQDEHYFEQDYFAPGSEYVVARTDRGRIGTLVCFDQWYPEPARIDRLMGAEILVYPTAIGSVRGIEQTEGDWKQAWESVQVGHAIANSVVVVAVNRVGTEGQTTFWGGSFVCDQFGKVLLRAGEGEGAYVVDCDLGLGKLVENGWGFMRNRQKKTYSRIVN